MFEQEIELEKKQSTAIPLLLIVGLILFLVGLAVYFLMESRRVLANEEATQVVAKILGAQGPTTVAFHTGQVKDRYDENPRDPRYKLLAKAGVITVGKAKGDKTPVALTPKGEDLIKQLAGVKMTKDGVGNQAYVVPLADRKLMQVSKVTMNGPERAAIQYTWRWQPNPLGEFFDASNGKLASFSTWDRVALIDKFGARFYQDPPTTVTTNVAKTSQGWQIASE
jgi:hypothetical protein